MREQETELADMSQYHLSHFAAEYDITHFKNWVTEEEVMEWWLALPVDFVDRENFHSGKSKTLGKLNKAREDINLFEFRPFPGIEPYEIPEIVQECEEYISGLTQTSEDLTEPENKKLRPLKYSSLHREIRKIRGLLKSKSASFAESLRNATFVFPNEDLEVNFPNISIHEDVQKFAAKIDEKFAVWNSHISNFSFECPNVQLPEVKFVDFSEDVKNSPQGSV